MHSSSFLGPCGAPQKPITDRVWTRSPEPNNSRAALQFGARQRAHRVGKSSSNRWRSNREEDAILDLIGFFSDNGSACRSAARHDTAANLRHACQPRATRNHGVTAMSNPARARGHEWQFVDNVFCLTLHGEDQHSVAIPIGALLTLAADGRRRQMALHRKTLSQHEAPGQDSAPLRADSLLPVQTWSVGTADNDTLVLVLDRGLDTELLLSLTTQTAETLADLFIKHARNAV